MLSDKEIQTRLMLEQIARETVYTPSMKDKGDLKAFKVINDTKDEDRQAHIKYYYEKKNFYESVRDGTVWRQKNYR